MSSFIFEFNPQHTTASNPPLYKVYCKHEFEKNYNCVYMSHEQLKNYISNFDTNNFNIETNDIFLLNNLGFDCSHIKQSDKDDVDKQSNKDDADKNDVVLGFNLNMSDLALFEIDT